MPIINPITNRPGTKPEGTIPTFGYLLENRDTATNTNKEYLAFLTETNVAVLQWGRIGTIGQSGAAKYPTYQHAEDAAMKQVHAKRYKGYKGIVDGMRFMATAAAVDQALNGQHALLVSEFRDALKNGKFTGQRDAVFKHYDEFARQASDTLDAIAAGTLSSAEALEQLGALEDVWAQIEERHAEVSTTLRITKSMAMQKLSGARA